VVGRIGVTQDPSGMVVTIMRSSSCHKSCPLGHSNWRHNRHL